METGNTVVFLRLILSVRLLLLLSIFAVYWFTGGAHEILSSLFLFSFFVFFFFISNHVFSCPRNFQSSLGSIADIVPRRFSGVKQS